MQGVQKDTCILLEPLDAPVLTHQALSNIRLITERSGILVKEPCMSLHKSLLVVFARGSACFRRKKVKMLGQNNIVHYVAVLCTPSPIYFLLSAL